MAVVMMVMQACVFLKCFIGGNMVINDEKCIFVDMTLMEFEKRMILDHILAKSLLIFNRNLTQTVKFAKHQFN